MCYSSLTLYPNFSRKYSAFFELNPDMEYLNTGEDFMQSCGSANDSSVDDMENDDENVNDGADEVSNEYNFRDKQINFCLSLFFTILNIFQKQYDIDSQICLKLNLYTTYIVYLNWVKIGLIL